MSSNKEKAINYLDTRNLNKEMSTEDFEQQVDLLSKGIYEIGFKTLVDGMFDKYTMDTIQKDFTKLDKTETPLELVISPQNTLGLQMIKKVHTHIYDVKSYKGVSVSGQFTINNIKKAITKNRYTHNTPYRSEIIRQLGFNAGTSKVTIYRPLLAKKVTKYCLDVYLEQMKNRETFKVFDPCMGWGGRMVGVHSLQRNNKHISSKVQVQYYGSDPCQKTYQANLKIAEVIGVQSSHLMNLCALKAIEKLDKHSFQMILTSPPYYNLEIYDNSPSQSVNSNINSYQKWYQKFLEPLVKGCCQLLDDNGFSVWSVKNIKTDGTYNLLDDVIKLHQEMGFSEITSNSQPIRFTIGKQKNIYGNMSKDAETTYLFKKIKINN